MTKTIATAAAALAFCGPGCDPGDPPSTTPSTSDASTTSSTTSSSTTAPPDDAGPCGDTSSDPSHCGRCGHGCLGGACVAGTCAPFVLATEKNLRHLAVNDALVVWSSDARVATIAKAGGSPSTLIADPAIAANAQALAVDATAAYFVVAGGSLQRTPLGGGGITELANDAWRVGSVVSDGTHVYYPGAAALGWTVNRVPVGGGAPSVLWTRTNTASMPPPVSPGALWLALGGQAVRWTAAGLRDDGGNSLGNALVVRFPLPDGPATTLAENLLAAEQIAIGGDRALYRVCGPPPGGKVLAVPVAGGPPTTIYEDTGVDCRWAIAADDAAAYVGHAGVVRAPFDGGTPVRLASSDRPIEMAVDDRAVYWITADALYAVAKP